MTKWSEEYLRTLIAKSNSVSDIIRLAGKKPSGGMHRHITGLIRRYNIDTSKFEGFVGQAWSRGKTHADDPRIKRLPDSVIFIENGSISRSQVRKRFLKTLVPYVCSECRLLPEWNGLPLTLHMDHINGISTDHRLENLRWLCPNCHSQTSTFSNKKAKRTKSKPTQTKDRPTKIRWPDIEILYKNTLDKGYSYVGEQLGVSDNAVKKRLMKFGYYVPRYHTQSKYGHDYIVNKNI